MKKRKKLQIFIIFGALILIIGIGYGINRYETEYINGVNIYQNEINEILGVNEPIFNSRRPKSTLEPVYGMIIDAYEENTYEYLNNIALNFNKDKNYEYIETIKNNQLIMKKMFDFSNKNDINYLNINQLNQFYNSIQKVIDSNFNIDIIKKEVDANKSFFQNKQFRKISRKYINDINYSVKGYPFINEDTGYSDCIWNNALMAFSYQGGGGRELNFNTVNTKKFKLNIF